MPEREGSGVGVIDPETGLRPEDFKFPKEDQNQPEQFPETGSDADKEFTSNPLADTEEFQLHQERFKKESGKHNQRGKLRRVGEALLGRDVRDLSPIDIAHAEALKENEDFEKRKHAEFKEWQRYLKVVIEHLKARRDDPEGEGKKYRPLLLILGGGMRGPYSAAQVIALQEMGLDATKFDTVVGISAGAGTATYFMAGKEQTYKGTAVYYDECTTKEFLDLMRWRHVMDSRVVGKVMRGGDKAVDQQAILDSPTEYYVAVTRQENKEAELINVKTAKPDMISAPEASMNVPLVKGPGIEVNGVPYIDGGFDALPLQQVIDKFHPTDILVLPQVPFKRLEAFKNAPGEWLLGSRLMDKLTPSSGMPGTAVKFLRIATQLRTMLDDLKKEKNVNVGILWPPERGLSNMGTDHDIIKGAVYETVRDTFKQFGEKEPDKIELYESPNKKEEFLDSELVT